MKNKPLILIISYMIIINISAFLVSLNEITIIDHEKVLLILSLISLPYIIYNFIKKKITFDKIDKILLIIFTGLIISFIFSLNQDISLWGRNNRGEGLVAIISYYIIYYLSRLIPNKKPVIITFIIIGLVQSFIGYSQVCLLNESGLKTAKGVFGNQNFYSTFMILELALVISIYLFKKSKKAIHLILIFTVSLLIADTSSGLLAFALILFISLIVGLKNLDKKFIMRYITVLALIITSLFIVSFTTRVNPTKEITKNINDTKKVISEKKLDDSYGTNRIYIWKNTIKKLPTYMWTGSGIDTFNLIYNDKLRIDDGDYHAVVDKTHSEYLQILITEGIITFTAYLLFLICIIKQKREIKSLEFIILLTIIAYLIQAIFNIRVTRVAPYFFILLGLISTKELKHD